MDKGAIGQQIGNDPRVQAYIRQRQRGSMPVELDAATLAAFGYQVEPDWRYRSADARNPGHLYDTRDKWDTIMPIASGLVMGYGLPLALAPATGAAPTALDQVANSGTSQVGQTADGLTDIANEFAPMSTLPSGRATNAGLAMNPSSVPANIASQGVSQGVPNIANGAGTPGRNNLMGIPDNVRDLLGLGATGLGLMNSMRSPAANASLERMLGLAEQRVTDSKPLFDALNTMAMAGLPKYARGEQ